MVSHNSLTMKTSDRGVNFIKEFEELRLEAYLDGGGVPTIGWGHTKGVSLGQTITLEQAEKFIREDLQEAELCIVRQVPYGLAQHQFDALVSLVFNIGVSAFTKSTLLKKLDKSDIVGAAQEFERWCYDNGRKIRGLLRRRKREQRIFLLGEYVDGI